MATITVLGAGMVGRAIARDLAQRHVVTSTDRDPAALAQLAADGIHTEQADLADPARIRALVENADLVVCAVPGFMGFQTMKTLIEAGKDVVDISFMPEDVLTLDALAKDKGVVVVVDMGVAPGMDNIILGQHDRIMAVDRFECLVGGLPKRRSYPFEYKAPFSPIDVIEEYTRPARFVEGGKVVTRPALSEPELVDLDPVGTLESFNSDGLRSLITTMSHIPDMKEKTLRYPGHAGLMAALTAGGFFSTQVIDVGGQLVRPLDVSSAILLDAWKLGPEEPEFTVMRVTVDGVEDGERVRYVYDLYDEYDPASKTSSMARTTGYACTAAVELVLAGTFSTKGVTPPELVGRTEGCFDPIMTHLEARGVRYRMSRTAL